MSGWKHAYCLRITDFVINHMSYFEYVFFTRKVRRNQLIYLMDDPAEHLYLVKEGAVRLTVISEDGREEIQAIRRTGEYFGALCLCPDYRWDHQATAHEDSIIAAMKAHDFVRVFFGHEELLHHFLAFFIRQLTDLSSTIAALRHRENTLRVLIYLDHLAHDPGARKINEEEVKVVVSPLYRSIAEATGLPQRDVENFLRHLRERMILDWKRNTLTIQTRALRDMVARLIFLRSATPTANAEVVASTETT